MNPGFGVPDGCAANIETTRPELPLDRRLDVRLGTGHRPAVGEQRDAPAIDTELRDDLGQGSEHAAAKEYAAEAELLQGVAARRLAQLAADAGQVADGFCGRTRKRHPRAPSTLSKSRRYAAYDSA